MEPIEQGERSHEIRLRQREQGSVQLWLQLIWSYAMIMSLCRQ